MEFKALDTYSIKARYAPTMIVLAPLFLIAASFFPEQITSSKNLLVLIGSFLGITVVFEQVGRDYGRKRQADLFLEWGGAPSTVFFRHNNPSIEPLTKVRYHKNLSELVGVKIPSEQEEKENSIQADEVYTSCGDFLRENTRDHSKFPLVFQENTNYGFRRNLWAMKPTGIVISAAGTAGCLIAVLYHTGKSPGSVVLPAVSTFFCALLLCFWICRFKKAWVRMTAEAYAKQLLAACDSLKQNQMK